MTSCSDNHGWRIVADAFAKGVVLTAGILLSFNALSQSCAELDSAQTREAIVESFNSSDFVFIGKPVDLESHFGPSDVQVEAYWKGPNLSAIAMRRKFIESDTRVLFASRSAIGGWADTWPECVFPLATQEPSLSLPRILLGQLPNCHHSRRRHKSGK
jgi:hypothetical protein